MKFRDVDIDLEDLNVRELKDFIRQGIDYINELYKYNEAENISFKKPQQHFFDEIQSKTTRGRFGNKLGYELNMLKSDLLDKAEDIRRFMKLSRDYDSERVNNAYDTFQQRYGNISREDYGKMINTFAGLGKDILEKFGSSNVVALITKYSDVSSTKIINIITNAINNPSNSTQGDLLYEVKENMKKYVNAVNRFKKK